MGLLDLILLETTATGDGGGEGAGTTPPGEEGTGSPQEGTEGPGGREGSADTVPRSELAKANSEAARYRKELREVQAKLQGIEDAQKTEGERAAEKLKTTEARQQELELERLDLLVQILAPEAGITDRKAAKDAAVLLDWEGMEDPTDENIVKALKKLVEDRPYLRGAAGREGADGGAGAGGAGSEGKKDMNQLLRQAAGIQR